MRRGDALFAEEGKEKLMQRMTQCSALRRVGDKPPPLSIAVIRKTNCRPSALSNTRCNRALVMRHVQLKMYHLYLCIAYMKMGII